MFDLLLKGGRIYDGSGMPSFNGDVAVSGEANDSTGNRHVSHCGEWGISHREWRVTGAYPGKVLRNTPPPRD